ncbi:TPA: site-2 protease family protein [Neisseria meningitidis]
MFQNFDLGVFLLAVLPVLLAITVREVARGYTARYWGDNTAEQYGRLTLNPLPHIDLVGTIIVPLLTLMFTPFLFGWARPIPIDSRNFRNLRLAWRCVAASGPLSNLAMAVLWGVVLVLTPYVGGAYQMPLAQMANYGILINAILFALNIIPILPWDGGIFIDTFLSAKYSQAFRKIEPYGTWIILLLMLTGVLGAFIAPIVRLVIAFVQMFV